MNSECPTFGQYLVGIFDRIAVSLARAKPENTRSPEIFATLDALIHNFQHSQINISVKKKGSVN